jgi:hypothetical protein
VSARRSYCVTQCTLRGAFAAARLAAPPGRQAPDRR